MTAAREANQIVVLAPQAWHQHIAQRMQELSASPAASAPQELTAQPLLGAPEGQPVRRVPGGLLPPVAGSLTPPTETLAAAEVDRVLHLRQMRAADLEQRLLALFGRRLRATSQDGYQALVLPIDQQRCADIPGRRPPQCDSGARPRIGGAAVRTAY